MSRGIDDPQLAAQLLRVVRPSPRARIRPMLGVILIFAAAAGILLVSAALGFSTPETGNRSLEALYFQREIGLRENPASGATARSDLELEVASLPRPGGTRRVPDIRTGAFCLMFGGQSASRDTGPSLGIAISGRGLKRLVPIEPD